MNDQFDDYGETSPKPIEKPTSIEFSSKDSFSDYPDIEPSPLSKDSSTDNAIQETLKKSEQSKQEYNDTPENNESLEELLNSLDQLIGLQRVKFEIRRLIQFVKISNLRISKGISKSPIALHSVYYGNPGTGKTTVARLYGKMLKSMGFLSKGHLIETDRAGLVGSYVGHTSNKTDLIIQEAIGGVLFIDEAYALSKGEEVQWDFGSEAVEILVKRMEDYRDNLVVIVAGYTEPMRKFIRSNEGLRSRFSTYIHFDDYSSSEMVEIFKSFAQQENYELHQEAVELIQGTIDFHNANRDKSFGNARFVRNLFELVIRNQAYRVGSMCVEPTISDLKLILPEDVPFISDNDIIETRM